MSINVVGESLPIPVDVFAGVATLSLTANATTAFGIENNPLNVDAGFDSFTLTPYVSDAGPSVNVQPPVVASLSLVGLQPDSVEGTPIQTDTDVTASTGVLTISTGNHGIESTPTVGAPWGYPILFALAIGGKTDSGEYLQTAPHSEAWKMAAHDVATLNFLWPNDDGAAALAGTANMRSLNPDLILAHYTDNRSIRHNATSTNYDELNYQPVLEAEFFTAGTGGATDGDGMMRLVNGALADLESSPTQDKYACSLGTYAGLGTGPDATGMYAHEWLALKRWEEWWSIAAGLNIDWMFADIQRWVLRSDAEGQADLDRDGVVEPYDYDASVPGSLAENIGISILAGMQRCKSAHFTEHGRPLIMGGNHNANWDYFDGARADTGPNYLTAAVQPAGWQSELDWGYLEHVQQDLDYNHDGTVKGTGNWARFAKQVSRLREYLKVNPVSGTKIMVLECNLDKYTTALTATQQRKQLRYMAGACTLMGGTITLEQQTQHKETVLLDEAVAGDIESMTSIENEVTPAKNWLRQPIGSFPTWDLNATGEAEPLFIQGVQGGILNNGVYGMEFEGGLILVNPKDNGTQTVTLPSGDWEHFLGAQDPSINDGSTVAATLQMGDATSLFLKRAVTVPAVGRIVQNGAWLEWPTGTSFFMCGLGDPEGFLYLGSRQGDGTRSGGEQQQIIDEVVLRGASAMYMQIVRSSGGDGASDENPFISSGTPSATLNQNILDQWRGWFEQLESARCAVLLFLYDDSAKPWAGGATVPADEQGFITNLVNEFKDLGNIVWCIAEEWYEAWSSSRNIAQAGVIRAADPDAVIANHGQRGAGYDDATGFGPFNQSANFNMFSTQENPEPGVQVTNIYDGMYAQVRYDSGGVVNKGAHVVNLSEARLDQAHTGNPTQDQVREYMWMTAMAGCYWQALEISGPQINPTEHITFIVDMGYCAQFFNSTDFSGMIPDNSSRASGASAYTLYDDTNKKYISWANSAGSLGITSVPAGDYSVKWRDCVNGTVDAGSVLHTGGTLTLARPGGYDNMTALYVTPVLTDWSYRSTMDGIRLNTNFPNDKATDITPFLWAGGNDPDRLADATYDTTIFASGGGALRITHRVEEGAGSVGWWRWNNGHPSKSPNQPSEPNDVPIYAQYKVWFPANRWLSSFTGSGQKIDIWAGNENGETCQGAEFTTYVKPSDKVYEAYTQCGGWDFRIGSWEGAGGVFNFQPQVDRGEGLSDNQRWCLNTNLLAGGETPLGNEEQWITVLKEVNRHSDGTADMFLYVQHQNDKHYRPILGQRDGGFGNGNFRALWLTAQCTGRIAGTGETTYHVYDEVLTSSQFIPATKYGGAPAWFEALTPNQWSTPPGAESFEDAGIMTYPTNAQWTFEAWNTFVMDTDEGELISAANGGHDDSKDNGVYGYLVRDDNPRWRLLAAASDDADIISNPSDGRYLDGTPASTHSYGALCYAPNVAKIFLCGHGSQFSGSGSPNDLVSAWSRTNWQTNHRGWDTFTYGTLFPIDRAATDRICGTAWDPVTGKIFTLHQNGQRRNVIDPHDYRPDGSDHIEQFNITTVRTDEYCGVGCGNHGLVAFINGDGETIVIDTSTQSEVFRGFLSNLSHSGHGSSPMWHEASDAILVWKPNGKNLYKVYPNDWSNPTTGWNADTITISGGITPDLPVLSGGKGMYNRCDIIPNMGNGEACIVAIAKHTSLPSVMRLTGGL